MAILSVKDLSKSFIYEKIFKDVNFHIEEGDKVGLIGQNGSGKTTLLNVLTGELLCDTGEIFYQKNSNPKYLKQYTKISSEKTILQECLLIFENIFKIEDKLRILEIEISNLDEESIKDSKLLDEYSKLREKYIELKGPEVNSRVTGVLKGLGFEEKDFSKIVNHLSGGQKSRINLAKLLLSNPDFMFLDEPTNHLDIQSINWLESYLRDYKGTFIVISHDRFFLDNIVNKIFLLENTKLTTYKGNYSNYQKLRQKELEVLKKQYENQQLEIERERKIIDKFLNVGREKSIRQGQSRLKKLEKIDLLTPIDVKKTAKIKFETNIKSGEDIFIGENLSKSFGEKKVFENIDFKVFRGDRIGIVGENGIGKSTLFNIISGKFPSDSGQLQIGTNVFIGYFDQEMSHLDNNKTIMDEIWDSYPTLTHFEIRSFLAKMMFLGDDILKEINTLSGGEKARVSLLKLMLSDSNVLLMDEPTNHLDIDSKEILEDALKDYNGTVISISHDRYFLNNYANKIWEMKRDSITEYLGDYNYYYQKKLELENPIEEKNEMTLTEKKALQKKQRQEINKNKKRRQEIQNLENEINHLEEEIVNIDEDLSNPDISIDYEKVIELGNKRAEFSEKIDYLYEKWIELQ